MKRQQIYIELYFYFQEAWRNKVIVNSIYLSYFNEKYGTSECNGFEK